MTVDYPDSPYKSIELVSLYLHCVAALGTGLFSALVECRINFECFGSDGKLKAEKEVEYKPDTLSLIPVEEQKKVNFESKFVGCKDIKFALVSSQLPGGSVSTAIATDSWTVVLHPRDAQS